MVIYDFTHIGSAFFFFFFFLFYHFDAVLQSLGRIACEKVSSHVASMIREGILHKTKKYDSCSFGIFIRTIN